MRAPGHGQGLAPFQTFSQGLGGMRARASQGALSWQLTDKKQLAKWLASSASSGTFRLLPGRSGSLATRR